MPKIKRYTHRHKDGSIWAKGGFKGDKMDGLWVWFRKHGSKMRSGYFKRGSRSANGLLMTRGSESKSDFDEIKERRKKGYEYVHSTSSG